MQRALYAFVVFAVVAAVPGCSSGSSGGSTCDTVCDCVANAHGDRNTCMNQCTSAVMSSSDPKNDCEDALKANGFPQCQDTCNGFSSSSTSLQPFCDKCASCVNTAGFDEGFCNPFKTSSGGFDTSACVVNGSRSELKQPTLSASQIASMSCLDFDAAE